MTQRNAMIIQDEHTRKAVDQQVTIGDLCMKAAEAMLIRQEDSQTFTVLSKGSIYYFNITCVGVKPPYSLQDPAAHPDTPLWFGQRMS